MKLNKLYTESIAHFSQPIQDWLIREAPHDRLIKSTIPDELAFLRGEYVDLGFENIGISQDQAMLHGFSINGLRIPGSRYRLRHGTHPDGTRVELATGSEFGCLPDNWKQGVLVIGKDDIFTWIGKLVRKDQIGDIDFSLYETTDDGWLLK